MISISGVENRLAQTPFEPFSIITNSGREYAIKHPENATVLGHLVLVLLPGGNGVVALAGLHIAEIRTFSRSPAV